MKQMAVSDAWSHLQSRHYQDLHIADIWLVAGKYGFLAHAIRWFQQLDGDDARFNHVAGYTGSGNILEALNLVTERSGATYFRSCHELKIVRNITWNEAMRADVLFEAKKYNGWPYGYLKVGLLQPLDCLFHTDLFTRKFTVTPLPYCSQLWAKSCKEAGVLAKVNGKQPESTQPDDWDDHAQKNPQQWRTVLEHDGTICRIYN